MKRVLVTGHTGFVGQALFESLSRDSEFELSGVSKRSSGIDLTDPSCVERLPPAEVVYHLAGAVGVVLGWQEPGQAYQSNFMSTLNVLEYCRRHKADLVFLSSYMYGHPETLPINESHRVQCLNPYARSKRAAENLCSAYAEDFGVNVSIVRPFNIYGVGEPETTIIGSLFKQLRSGNKVEVHSLNTKRDFLYLEDLVALLKKLGRHRIAGSRVYNIGSGESHSTSQLISLLEQVLGRKIEVVVRGEPRRNEILDCFSDNSRIKNELGFAPSTSLFEGLKILAARQLRGT